MISLFLLACVGYPDPFSKAGHDDPAGVVMARISVCSRIRSSTSVAGSGWLVFPIQNSHLFYAEFTPLCEFTLRCSFPSSLLFLLFRCACLPISYLLLSYPYPRWRCKSNGERCSLHSVVEYLRHVLNSSKCSAMPLLLSCFAALLPVGFERKSVASIADLVC